MKHIKSALVLVIAITLSLALCACNGNTKSDPQTYDLHEDCIELLYENGLLLIDDEGGEIFNGEWITANFIESYITFEEDEDFEIFIHLKQNKRAYTTQWFYIRAADGEIEKVSKTIKPWFLASLGFIKNDPEWNYTDRVDKRWVQCGGVR